MEQLLSLWQDSRRASADVKRLALRHIEELECKADALRQMADSLHDLVSHCQGDHRPDCPIINELETGGAGKDLLPARV